ncbi:alkane 1-monooxygenase [Rhodococcus sp. BP-149]|nr:alkane 1-monooxygenase [Rhodococcus sp. BP-316]MBY6684926.1 alkane 1-monooxygenase [Rhodococcus sp. BP-288]MBY6692590.1 alkane 1-monooxygenase [Rhodococcus sp. BP-188]MBY6698488.1 alkane 1-monooxygenase [Rhodococcus sp. BP-285]MBY6701167.1 alkane 1-monooxygenase [Rhodococcus sp. BP-283]MBY6707004.1 alkane 1-monooxygenase [Rhodococcus sp. BP-241]MBY6712168.1 alkane 1-monooxygenase [Rhodococcus sp. BP-160]MBY6717316.1 alkane 1-monooxygenase [Rhodococcus sp. BP-110]MBY6720240.1 alkane 1-mon
MLPLISVGIVFGLQWWAPGVSQVAWWSGPLFLYVVVPIADRIVVPFDENPPEDLVESLEADFWYRGCVYAYIPMQFFGIGLSSHLLTADDLSWLGLENGLSLASKIGVALTIGLVGGIGINTAHELGHKKVEYEQWLSRIVLAQSFYGHFYVEHNRGHHVRVATPEDPASSRLGETLWQFYPRSVLGGFRSGWALERDRLHRTGKRTFSFSNANLTAWLMSLALWGALVGVFGVELLPFLVLQAVYGISLLEAVNYLEHYGLLRRTKENGRYERCTPEHSWNSDYAVSDIFLYHLQRHSDHHANPTRRYQVLRSMPESPQLPAGYAPLILVSYFPFLWRALMDKRVVAHYDGDLRRSNIQPAKREKYLAKFPAPTR